MADPTNRSDPTYSSDPHYVWSGGRWQYRSTSSDANYADPNTAQGGKVSGSTQAPGWWQQAFGDPNALAGDTMRAMGIGQEINNFAGYQNLAGRFRQGAIRDQAVNPYSAATADQSRAAQMALLAQMRAQQAGTSLAGLQGQRGMAQSGQQALAAAALGGPARAAMMQAGQQGGGMAGDIGQARLAEIMRMQAGQGGLASGLRGNDLRSADAQMGAGMRAQELADQRARFYAQLGLELDKARSQAASDNERMRATLGLQKGKEQIGLAQSIFGAGATALSSALGSS